MVRVRRTSLRDQGGRLDQAGDLGKCGAWPGQHACVCVSVSVCAPSMHRQGQVAGVDRRTAGGRWCSPGSLPMHDGEAGHLCSEVCRTRVDTGSRGSRSAGLLIPGHIQPHILHRRRLNSRPQRSPQNRGTDSQA